MKKLTKIYIKTITKILTIVLFMAGQSNLHIRNLRKILVQIGKTKNILVLS